MHTDIRINKKLFKVNEKVYVHFHDQIKEMKVIGYHLNSNIKLEYVLSNIDDSPIQNEIEDQDSVTMLLNDVFGTKKEAIVDFESRIKEFLFETKEFGVTIDYIDKILTDNPDIKISNVCIRQAEKIKSFLELIIDHRHKPKKGEV